MNKNKIRTIAAAIVLTVGAGTTPMVMAQPRGGSDRDMMNWGNPSQYGAFEILAVLIGVAVLTLLVVLVVRVSGKSRTP